MAETEFEVIEEVVPVPQPAAGQPHGPAWNRLAFWAVTAVVLALGWLEGWYGPTVAGDVYGSDAVQYLDIARAFERGDWHAALNPLWSDGYPALLACIRPHFAPGLAGEWNAIRWLDFGIWILSWLGFCAFLRELLRGRSNTLVTRVAAVCIFVTAQLCVDQVSRVGPDQLVAAIFFFVCALLLRLARRPGWGASLLLGLLLGLGFLVKSIFLPLGAIVVLTVVIVLVSRAQSARIWPVALVFSLVVAGYGIELSRATGTRTLGESGSLNYAWHVNRLAKWVHWEGGTDPADKAWPKPWIAHFVHWDTAPPDFGTPLHPSVMAGNSPRIYSFHAPVSATYIPYFDPPYFYQGYRHVLNWRYQVVALGKNLGDMTVVLIKQPLFWCMSFIWLGLLAGSKSRKQLWQLDAARLAERSRAASWPVFLLAVAGIAIYLPVHLEGRYLSAFLAVMAVVVMDWFAPALAGRRVVVSAVLLAGFAVGLAKDQHEVWSRARHHWNYRDILEWREGEAVGREGLAPGSEIGVISWTPNLQCDWAYLANVQITSEIATPSDEKAFWALPYYEQAIVLMNFRQAGAEAVLTRDQPAQDTTGWRKLDGVPVWIYRFE